MNRTLVTLSALSALFLVTVAGCASSTQEEDSAVTGDALTAGIIDQPAVTPVGSKPKVVAVDLTKVDFDLSHYNLTDSGTPDYSTMKIDVLDTRAADEDNKSLNLKWVERDKTELPSFIDKAVNGIDVGGGKCRIDDIGLKKIVVGCKWTW